MPMFERVQALLRHRGPDDTGVERFETAVGNLVLGQTRLSIIDLSEGGHQPMHSRCGRYAIVYNGEVYNYRELRETLRELGHHFSTDSDTEVLLACWREWQADCLTRLTGMFAFAVYDRVAGTLTCVRDAFGIKPFYFHADGGRFAFASELPALRPMMTSPPSVNWQRAYEYLAFGIYDSDDSTFFAGIRALAPAHYVTLDTRTGALGVPVRWWSPTIAERKGVRFDDAVEMVREAFLDNIRLHLRSDVPLGAALSGGIDSSAVVCGIRHIDRHVPINSFSFIAGGSALSEERWVDRITSYAGAKSHKVVLGGDDLARDLDDLVVAQGEPFGSTSIYAQYAVFRLARENGVKVTLDGQGADELLAGYSGYPGQRLRSLVERGEYSAAWRFLNQWARWPGRSRADAIKRFFGEVTVGPLHHLLRSLNGMSGTPSWLRTDRLRDAGVRLGYPELGPHVGVPGRRTAEKLADSLTRNGLPTLLRHGDRNSMRFSIESRVPFLTTGLADSLLTLPEHFLISPSGETKHVFRAAMRGIVPEDVLDRRDKIGFATPEFEWLTAIAPHVRTWLSDADDIPFIDRAQILRIFDDVIGGRRAFSWQIWRWLNFFRWHQRCIAG
jgi:asparagine synthase (glutamine-hydrolysing)